MATQCLDPPGRNDGKNKEDKQMKKKTQLPVTLLPQDGTIEWSQEIEIKVYKIECNC